MGDAMNTTCGPPEPGHDADERGDPRGRAEVGAAVGQWTERDRVEAVGRCARRRSAAPTPRACWRVFVSPVSAHAVMYALCSVPTCALSSVASTPCSQLQYALVIVIQTWRSSSAVNGSSGNGERASPEPHPHDAAALVHRVVLDRHLGCEGLGIRRVGGRVADEPADVDLPAVEDAPQPAVLVACEHERAAAVRTRFGEEADATVAGAERDVVAAEEAHALWCTVGLELRGEDRGDPVVLADETPHRSVTLDSGQQFVLLVGQHDSPPHVAIPGLLCIPVVDGNNTTLVDGDGRERGDPPQAGSLDPSHGKEPFSMDTARLPANTEPTVTKRKNKVFPPSSNWAGARPD